MAKASKRGQQILKDKLRQLGLSQTASQVLERAGSIGVAKRFFQGDDIRQDTFTQICEFLGVDLQEAIARTPQIDLKGAQQVRNFYGRTAELQQLEQWIMGDRYQIVTILGMGGMGKTSLASQLAHQLKEEFEFTIWRSLRNAPSFESILTDILQFLSHPQPLELPDTLPAQLDLLMRYLDARRCLLVIDNWESILSDRYYYRSGYEGYGDLLRYIGERSHQSCLVMTSRETPPELSRLIGDKVRSLNLSGLSQQDGLQIFERESIAANDAEWQEIITHYAGNPLALKIVAAGIRDLLGGDVAQMLALMREGGLTFGDIQDLLHRQFLRLSEAEQEVMYWLAIAREPISILSLKESLLSRESKQRLITTLELLKKRSLLEVTATGFTLQPVVMEYVNYQFIEKICQEINCAEQKLNLLHSHALIEATAKDYIRDAQTRFILQSVADKVDYQAIAAALTRLKTEIPPKQGYAGGNLLNLLCYLHIDLTGYDFSNLSIWQADLREVELHRVNFSNCDLSKSAFRVTFSSVMATAFSPDGKILATSDVRGWIYLWLVTDGSQLFKTQAHSEFIFALAFSHDGKTLASGSLDRTIKLWKVKTGECLLSMEAHALGVASIAFSPDDRLIASCGGDRTVKLTKVKTGKCLMTLEGHEQIVRSVAFSPDGQMLASCSLDRTIKLWSVQTGECRRTIVDFNAVYSLAFAPQIEAHSLEGQLASAGEDGLIKIWDVNTGQIVSEIAGHQKQIWAIAFSADGQMLASAGDDETVKLWSVSTGEVIRTLYGHKNRIWSVAFSPDTKVLVSGSDDRIVKLWDVGTGQCIRTIQGYHRATKPVVFSPDGDLLFSFSYEEQSIRVWDVQNAKCLRNFDLGTSGVMQVAFSPDQQTFACGNYDHTVKIFDSKNGTCAQILQGHSTWVRFVIFSPNGEMLISGSGDRTIKLWHLQTGECLNTLCGHISPIQALVIHANGEILASGSWDGTIKIWDLRSPECLMTLAGHSDRIESLAFSQEGMLISGSVDRSIKFWDLATGICTKTIQSQFPIWTLSLSPTSPILAFSGYTLRIKLWCLQTHQYLTNLEEDFGIGYMGDVIFSAGGQILASGGEDGTNRLWNIQTGKSLKLLKIPRPYEDTNIAKVKGLTEAQKSTLKALGAIEDFL
ncbi:high-affnity carbon uptake protein Hat/HatR [Pseudanabaena sp. lw0831]|uniref:NB-ARC domain-containing protein n=1 Tax=Pseudanabaena sp. lw0831 TaxID=1357935 RepID=UPI001915EFE4|nr:NB-ARC domain-containing protein [Pseudanabaena sp. lw0831]GBO51575.1 high-affnity carbon uptake protein Hat/HatR [Pseudanabaena sp. lw0831]